MFDLFNEIAQTIRNNKLRTGLTGLAVAWGIFMLIVLLGAARGVKNAFEDRAAQSPQNTIEIYGGYTTQAYRGYEDGRKIKLKDDDPEAIKRGLPGYGGVSITANVPAQTITGPKESMNAQATAVSPDYLQEAGFDMKYGRFINENDMASQRKAIVLPETKAATMFGDAEKALGQPVKMYGLSWTVVGVYSHRWRKGEFVPYATFKALTGSDPNVQNITVTVNGLQTIEDGDRAEGDIRKALGRKHDFNPDDMGAIWAFNNFNNYLSMQNGLGYLGIAVWVIGILTLLTGIVGVSNIMFVSVKERTHEIGIRRAIGAKPRSVVTQILAESVAITALFGYIGIFMGFIVLEVINKIQGDSEAFRNPTLDLSIAVEVTLALIAAGALAGLFPALKAVKVKPVEALRDE